MSARGGWYCSDCGWTTKRLPDYEVHCGHCGALGLRGFDNARPIKVPCPVEGCPERVWDDGGVNPGKLQHLWGRHERALAAPAPDTEEVR